MKHPNYPKATNQYLGTTTTSLPKSAKESHNEEMIRFGKHLKSLIEKQERKKELKKVG